MFGPLIKEMKSLLDTYGDGDLSTIRDFLDRAATVISRAGPGASATPDPAEPQTSRTTSRRPRLPGPP